MSRVFLSDEVERAVSVAKRHIRKDGINLGNSIVLENASIPTTPALWFQNRYGVVAAKRLLTATKADIAPDERGPGSWVVSLQAEVIENGAPTGPIYTPLVARVSYGTGGASQTIEVDAFRSIFAIPADDFTIDVGWSQPGTENTSLANPVQVPLRTRVTALVHRSQETGESVPTRTCSLIQDLAPPFAITVPIPAQAVSWTIGSPYPITSASVPISAASLYSGSPGAGETRSDSPEPAVITAMIRGRCFREIPANSRFMSVSIDTLVAPYYFLTFRLGI